MNTNIYKEFLRLYEQTPQRSIWKDVVYYFMEGYIFSGDNYLLMGERIGNGWFIHAAVGKNSLKKFLTLMPYYLPWIGWAREQKSRAVKWHKTETIRRRIKNYELAKLIQEKSYDSGRRIRRRGTAKTTASTSSSYKNSSFKKCGS